MRHGVSPVFRIACVVLALAACTGAGEPSTTSSQPLTTTSRPIGTTTTEDPLLNLALPIDPDVVRGQLDNGLTYYIRENDSPGGRAELRLLVDAGSVQEDPDQAGTAHFLEHMMFNGTERFPRNDLIDALESFGPRFGPDINAHTSFDETVYELSLSTEDDELIRLGIDVLREWASRATLTEADVIDERGVIVDEWRLRAQGFGSRLNNQLESVLLEGSVYEGQLPIGTRDSIQSTTPGQLRRFYEDWYRPERMAVVAVGDIDAASMENMIADTFGDIETEPNSRPWDGVGFDPLSNPSASSLVDAEATTGGVTIFWPTFSGPLVTVGDYQRTLATSLGIDILAQRLSDDAQGNDGPLLGAAVLDFEWTRVIAVRGVDAQIRPEQLEHGMETVLHEVERIRRHGVSDAEFERAMSAFSALSRQIFEQRESVQDIQFATQIAGYHLAGDPLMSPGQRFDVESGIVDRLTKADLEQALTSLMATAPGVLVVGPDDQGVNVPDEGQVLELLGSLSTVELAPRPDVDPGGLDLMMAPDPAPIVSNIVDPTFGYTTLEFDNGAVVYLWPSQIASQSVYAMIEGFGGTSVVEVEDLPEAHLVTDIAVRSGVADLDLPAVRRQLANQIVSVQPWISETRQGLEASSSTADVETMLQLIHLTMTRPRFDPAAAEATIDELRAANAARDDLPEIVFDEAIGDAYYGDDPRYFVLPSSEQLDEFDLTVAESVFRERFGNAGDFGYVFVGDFDTRAMIDLTARYIGTLPGGAEPIGFVDNQPLPPREIQVVTVHAGTDEQGQLGMFFTNEFHPVLEDRIAARLVELILSARLRERVREELGATYSISAAIDLQNDPDPFAEAMVSSTGDPTGLEQISAEILTEIAVLQEEGPSEADFNTAVEQLRDELDLLDNRLLATGLITAHLYPDQPITDLADRHRVLEQMTPGHVKTMAGIVFDLDQRIEVRQVPRT